MEQFMGISRSGKVTEAVSGLNNPKFIIVISAEKDLFESQVKEIESLYPGVPSIGCVGQSYEKTTVLENGLLVVGFTGGVRAVTNALTNVASMPVKCVQMLENDVQKLGADSVHTVCIDFCSGNDECVLTTINSVLRKKGIQLTGGTAWEGLVSANGKVYEDACAYALVYNETGKVKVYKENLYVPTDKQYIVTKANPAKNMIMELNGQSAEKAYTSALNISPDKIETQTFQNPFGRIIGDEVYIVSIKERSEMQSLSCFRKTYPKDVLNILQMGDYAGIVDETISKIKGDFPKVSGVFSINCLFRYLYFQDQKFVDQYFAKMDKLGAHAGLIGLGEHYNGQHTNQTFSCVVFE